MKTIPIIAISAGCCLAITLVVVFGISSLFVEKDADVTIANLKNKFSPTNHTLIN